MGVGMLGESPSGCETAFTDVGVLPRMTIPFSGPMRFPTSDAISVGSGTLYPLLGDCDICRQGTLKSGLLLHGAWNKVNGSQPPVEPHARPSFWFLDSIIPRGIRQLFTYAKASRTGLIGSTQGLPVRFP